MSWPAALLWVLVVPAFAFGGPSLLYLLSVVGVFMSLQMLPGDGGGATLLPPIIFAAAVIARVALAPGNPLRALDAALDPRRLGLFTAFICYAILSALLLPRLFSGLIEVIPVSGADLNGSSLLQPRSGNYTQTGYMTISYFTALAFAVIGSRVDIRRHYMQALLFGALALIATGLLDLVTYHLGMSGLLDPFRTANYALLTDVEAAGAKRVVGLTPEASTYGSLCVSAGASLLFLRHLYPQRPWRIVATLTCFCVLVMALLSTSATAYVGGAVLCCVYLFDLVRRLANPKAIGRDTLWWEIRALVGFAVVASLVMALLPDRVAPLFDVLDKVIFQKSASLSYYQRSMWSRVGWQAFLDTGGIGAGLGSVRTSNWVISILASTGFVGGGLVFGFVLQKLLTSSTGRDREDAAFCTALKYTIPPFFVMSLLGGTIPDIGVNTAAALGLLSCSGVVRRSPAKAGLAGPAVEREAVVSGKRSERNRATRTGSDVIALTPPYSDSQYGS